MAIVVLDISKFRAMFPEFSNVTDAQLPFLFDQATDYLNNTDFSLVVDVIKRERLLYLLMAHLAYVRYGDVKGNGGTGMVGRLSSASEGSVSVSSEAGQIEFRYMWYTQSQYGMEYWQATKVYRMANYYPGCV
ncbi:DUF4054 domain-containing protein [Lelliottia sp. T2.26D-8]|uniref:DUF4054 domain-containing protein n=1 Tax=Lelliottia sp. T2.26D-8 TaxID=3041165 RepID=UPI002477AB8E|nr:DUF4054 domain-containing protein [Lelliottia sp. T2.26D-8]CAI9399182.1 hypothetical protein CCAJJPOJ_00166 [Lelliottia sp. T2.26D-8]